MGLRIIEGRNSKHIKNSNLSPAKLSMVAYQGAFPYSVSFEIVGRPGQFADTTQANYTPTAQGGLYRFLLNEASKRAPIFLKGELTTRYEGVTPKQITFDIIFRADDDLPPREIIEKVQILQSMCYPRRILAGNPPLCILQVLNLYCLEVYVMNVHVNWHNEWNIRGETSEANRGLPMGCDINVTCFQHQYPSREEILAGAGFDSTGFTGNGYSGTFNEQDKTLTLTHSNEKVQAIINRDYAYAANTKAGLEMQAKAKKAAEIEAQVTQ